MPLDFIMTYLLNPVMLGPEGLRGLTFRSLFLGLGPVLGLPTEVMVGPDGPLRRVGLAAGLAATFLGVAFVFPVSRVANTPAIIAPGTPNFFNTRLAPPLVVGGLGTGVPGGILGLLVLRAGVIEVSALFLFSCLSRLSRAVLALGLDARTSALLPFGVLDLTILRTTLATILFLLISYDRVYGLFEQYHLLV
jgi:hypothetical protein